MRHTTQRIAFIVALCSSAGLWTGCETVQDYLTAADRPTARVVDASLADFALDSADLVLDVEVTNPYGVALPTPAIEYALSSGGASIVRGEADAQGAIPANGKRTLRVPVGVVFADVLNAVRGVKPGEVVPYEFDGALVTTAPGIGDVRLPLSRSGELPVPAPPAVSLAGIDVDNLSLTSADLTARADVTNPNAFRLALSQLDYDLSLAGREVASAAAAEAPALGPGDAGSFSFPISVRPIDLGAAFINVLRGSSASYALQGAFAADSPFGPITLPVDRAGSVPLSR
ncbi:MAG: LEA type 2 family protein [Planctomycetota bacterium]